MSTLREVGFKFGWDGKVFNWFHPADVLNNDKFIDCTDMDDIHFERLVFILTVGPDTAYGVVAMPVQMG